MANMPPAVPPKSVECSQRRTHYREHSRLASSVSSEETIVEAPGLDEVRRPGAVHYSKQFQDRCHKSKEQMERRSIHKGDGEVDLKYTRYSRDSTALPREPRARSHSDHTSRHHKSGKEHSHGSAIYVYKYIDENKELEPTPVRRPSQVTESTFIGDQLKSRRSVGLPLLQAPNRSISRRYDDEQRRFRDKHDRRRSSHEVDAIGHKRGTRIEYHDRSSSLVDGRYSIRR